MKKVIAVLLALSMVFSLAACGRATAEPKSKNVILMISDGTSVGIPTLTRWCASYDRQTGVFNTDTRLNVDPLTSGLIRTYWENADGVPGAITDSAPGGTAFSIGYKTADKYVGVAADGTPHATVLELAKSLGKSTGLVVTVNVQHATPAAFSAHTTNRRDYEGIAAQMLETGVDVVLGGGSVYLQNRADGRDLLAELQAQGYDYLTTGEELAAYKGRQVYGLFAPDLMEYDIDRSRFAPEQPSLSEMTDKAIEILSQNNKGFFLMVEGSKVDWAAHNNDPAAAVSEYRAFDEAVKSAVSFAQGRNDTMVLIVEDHGTGGVSIGSEMSNKTYSSYQLADSIEPLTRAQITTDGALRLLAQGHSAEEVL
ncbi:MAG: alkaline phosphatase, partial [Clostridia bacterium]